MAGDASAHTIAFAAGGFPLRGRRNSSAAPTAFPGAAGRIAFNRVVAGPSPSGVPLAELPTVYTIRSDGRDARPPTARAASDYEPAWSPDGTMIAFRRVTDPPQYDSSEIYLVRSGRLAPECLTRNAEGEKTPSWPPRRLADRVPERGGAIWVMRADGTHPRRLVPEGIAVVVAGRPLDRIRARSDDRPVRSDGSGRRPLGRSEYYSNSFGFGEPVEGRRTGGWHSWPTPTRCGR